MEHLIDTLRRLPGLGRRTAERIALRLVRDRSRRWLRELIEALKEADAGTVLCSRCGHFTPPETDPCRLCTDPRREDRLLCVVAQPDDITTLEKSGAFHGRYHALMGRISPMNGEGPSSLRLDALLRRASEGTVEEVVLALDTDVESDATAQYLAEKLKKKNIRITRLAYGMPAGSGIAYSDPLTLSRAMEGRRSL